MEGVEESVKISDDCMAELQRDQEENGDRLRQWEGRVKELEFRLGSLEDSVELSDGWSEESEDKLELLEERVAVLKVQNTELRDHLNSVIDVVNSITQMLNNISATPPVDDQPKLAVQQVYDMYQSQPLTEEGWQEMTDTIKAAEEYEARPAHQLFNVVNGLTPDEWKDLLQLS